MSKAMNVGDGGSGGVRVRLPSIPIELAELPDAGKHGRGAQPEGVAVPTFTLRADKQGHLLLLRALLHLLPPSEREDGRQTLREFELWEEAHHQV